MLDWFYQFLKPRLFKKFADDHEKAHEYVLAWMRYLSKHPSLCQMLRRLHDASSSLTETKCFGLTFPNPIGLAAGMDKNCVALPAFAALGFGFIEGGGVTLQPQEGNPRPRLQRCEEDESIWNSMGFNNDGAKAVYQRLISLPELPVPIGINVGKGKNTPNEEAAREYASVVANLYLCADYFTINVSSPNTPGLRQLQHAEYLGEIIREVRRRGLVHSRILNLPRPKPILVKLAALDMTEEVFGEAVLCCWECHADGIILGNTQQERLLNRVGGRSGPGLFDRMLWRVRNAVALTDGMLPVIACGGIDSVEKIPQVLDAGAVLCQLYTGLVFKGPGLPKKLARAVHTYRQKEQEQPLLPVRSAE